MAAFPGPLAAMEASVQMTRALGDFNVGSGLPPLSLKIGLHSGPCIVVTSNERLDYFGQTVNVAARVQGLAEGDEIVVTDAAWDDGLRELAIRHHLVIEPSRVSLKGVADKVLVHTLRWTGVRG